MANNESDHDRLIRIDENTQHTVTHLEKLNGRVRRLEIWKGTIVGGMAVIIFVVSLIARHIF